MITSPLGTTRETGPHGGCGSPPKPPTKSASFCSTPIKGTEFIVELTGRRLRGTAKKTASWYDYQTVVMGRVEVSPGVEVLLSIRAGNPDAWRAVNVRSIQLNNVNSHGHSEMSSSFPSPPRHLANTRRVHRPSRA